MRTQKDWIKLMSWQTNNFIFLPRYFLFWYGLIEKRRGEEVHASFSFLESPRGVCPFGVGGQKREGRAPSLLWHGKRKREGQCPLSCEHKNLKGHQRLVPPLLALWDEGAPSSCLIRYGHLLFLPYRVWGLFNWT